MFSKTKGPDGRDTRSLQYAAFAKGTRRDRGREAEREGERKEVSSPLSVLMRATDILTMVNLSGFPDDVVHEASLSSDSVI